MTQIELSGKRFGKLVAVRPSLELVRGRAGWLCRCDCGRSRAVRTSALTTGNTRSCGCEKYKGNGGATRRHGMSFSDVYSIWGSMRQRCSNPNTMGYENYGGRGIEVCERWQKFENFLSDMGPRPSKQYSIDRIDPNGNYEPQNCRWLRKQFQQRNTRRNVLTWQKAHRARELRKAGIPYKEIAVELHSTYGAVKQACRGNTWK